MDLELVEKLREQGVPQEIYSVVEDLGLVGIDADQPEANIYRTQLDGRCATCHAPLGEDTMIFAQGRYVVALFCGGACMTDMQVIGWLQEQHGDIVDAVAFRGQAGNKETNDE